MATKRIHYSEGDYLDLSPCGANLPKDKVSNLTAMVTCPGCLERIAELAHEREVRVSA